MEREFVVTRWWSEGDFGPSVPFSFLAYWT